MTAVIVVNPPARGTVTLAIITLPPEYVMTTDAGSLLVSDNGGLAIPDRARVVTDTSAPSISDDGRTLTTDS